MLNGAKIGYLRERAGYSRPELAAKSGVDRRTISLAEQCLRAPRFSTLRLLADALGCKVADFFDDDDPNPRGRGYPEGGYEGGAGSRGPDLDRAG